MLTCTIPSYYPCMVLDKLTDEQVQRLLVCEHGSINESFVEIYKLTGEIRFLEWAGRLNDRAMWVPLSEGKDILFGWHANTQIPKFTGGLVVFFKAGELLGYCEPKPYMGNRRE